MMGFEKGQILYRYVVSWSDPERETVRLEYYRVAKPTPKGAWIERVCPAFHCDGEWIPTGFSKNKFVLWDSAKKFAYPDKGHAFYSYQLRTYRRLVHLLSDFETAMMRAESACKGVVDVEMHHHQVEGDAGIQEFPQRAGILKNLEQIKKNLKEGKLPLSGIITFNNIFEA